MRKGRQADRGQPHGPKPTYDIVGFKSGRCRAFRLRWLVLVGKSTITQHDTVPPAQPCEAHTRVLVPCLYSTYLFLQLLQHYPVLTPNSRKIYKIWKYENSVWNCSTGIVTLMPVDPWASYRVWHQPTEIPASYPLHQARATICQPIISLFPPKTTNSQESRSIAPCLLSSII